MYIYFVRTGDAIKVGIAAEVNKRMVNIQVGNPHKIEVLHSINASEEQARRIESQIHQLFRKTHLNGEWFQANQFMIDFVSNIKQNGWESHSEWIARRYHEAYGHILTALENKIEQDTILGNMVSLEKLKEDLGRLVNTIYAIPSLPTNIAEAIRNWTERRKEPFVVSDIYKEFGISTKHGKANIRQILHRLVADNTLERSGIPPKCIYRKTSTI